MRLTVFGASGATGREIVSQALGHGHDVVAFVRDPSGFDITDERLRIAKGDVLDPVTVDAAVRGSVAVLSAIGSRRGRESTRVYSDGTHNIIEAMGRYAVMRLVCVTAAGVGTRDDPNLPFLYRRLLMSVVLRGVYEDMERMEDEVMLSDLNWTIVRPAGLADDPATGEYRVAEGRSLPKGSRISRADLAGFMLKCAETDLFSRKGVAIAH
ncbi:MAG: SDR family oxidoreductase [Coriobacteriia bacterium]|nr:SDR family oxidoreductase [Coriobacteriia bacterium]